MKEKFIKLLEEQGITVEMGMTPTNEVYVMHWEKDEQVKDFWFVETEDGIDMLIPYFVKIALTDFIFACVENEDYQNGKYMIGKLDDISDHISEKGLCVAKAEINISFDELLAALN